MLGCKNIFSDISPAAAILNTGLSCLSCVGCLCCYLLYGGMVSSLAVKSLPWETMLRNHRNHAEATFPPEVGKSDAKPRQVFWVRL